MQGDKWLQGSAAEGADWEGQAAADCQQSDEVDLREQL